MGVDLNTILAIIGAMGGIEGIKWGIRAWANRKTNARIAEAQADVEEFKALREYNEFLQKQLSEKEERFVEQTGRLRQVQDELLPMMPSYDGESQALSDMYGMNNLLALAANSKILAYTPTWSNPDQYPAHNFCAFTKGQEIGSPLNDWWLPSLGELASLGDNIDLINGRITQAGGDAIKGLYLSSTQKDQYEAWAYAILPDGNTATEWYKADPAGVRAVTGFSL